MRWRLSSLLRSRWPSFTSEAPSGMSDLYFIDKGLSNPPAMKRSESFYLDVRGLRYHLRAWGPAGAPTIYCVHGWLDASASYQFIVDALTHEWRVVAPDWRGEGLTQWAAPGTYVYPEYVADLDAILEQLS